MKVCDKIYLPDESLDTKCSDFMDKILKTIVSVKILEVVTAGPGSYASNRGHKRVWVHTSKNKRAC